MKTVKSDSTLSDGELTAETADIDVSSFGSSSSSDTDSDDDDHYHDHLGIDIDIGIGDDDDDDDDDENDENDDGQVIVSYDTASTSTDTTTAGSVSWGPVHVREYERVISDAASPSFGVPIGIGWKSVELPPVSIEEWETDRIKPRRQNLKLSSITRKNMMQTVWGYSEDEVRQAERENQKIKYNNFLSSSSKSNDDDKKKPKTMVGKIGKKVKRASWTLLKGFGAAASQNLTMMSSPSPSTSTSGQSSMSMGGFIY